MNQPDTMLRALLHEQIRVSAISGGHIVEEARHIHSLSRVCTAALGRQLMATAMMTEDLKHPTESLTSIIKGDGPAGNLVCTGRYGGLVKGYVSNPHIELPLRENGKLDVGGAVGKTGRLTLIRDLSMRTPYTGECSLVSGEIAEDFAQYFTLSEQQPSLVYLGVRVNPHTGHVLAAGGLIAQPMPGCPDIYIDALQALAPSITTLTERLEGGLSLRSVLEELFREESLRITQERTPRWECDCSRTRTERALIALGREELTDMITTDKRAELTCQFCNAAYQFTENDLRALLQEAQANQT